MLTEDEVLTACEDRWRRAALDDTPQFRGYSHTKPLRAVFFPPGRETTCAYLILGGIQDIKLGITLASYGSLWSCPECGYGGGNLSMPSAIVHLNNAHDWTWNQFANKFRDVWARGCHTTA